MDVQNVLLDDESDGGEGSSPDDQDENDVALLQLQSDLLLAQKSNNIIQNRLQNILSQGSTNRDAWDNWWIL